MDALHVRSETQVTSGFGFFGRDCFLFPVSCSRTHGALFVTFIFLNLTLISLCRCFHLHIFYVIQFGLKKGDDTHTHTCI